MKKTVQYIALAAFTLSLAACQQDNALQEINDPNAVKINATIGALQSRVTYDDNGATSFSNGDGIKVQNTKRTSKNEATYTYNGTTWSIQEGSLVWNSGENTNQFNAWYPATASYDSFELPEDQSDASKLAAADWMTATIGDMSKPEDCKLNLSFAHKLAKVTVNISETHGSQFVNSPTLDEVKIYTHDGTKTIIPMAGTNSYTAIVTPGQYNGPNNFMTFKVGEDEFTVKPTTTLTSGLEAGKHYTFTLTVGKDKATIGNVSVADWGTSQEITGGVAEEVPVINYVWTSGIEASASVEGAGTENSPYLIHSANDLQWMIDQVNTNGVTGKYFQLTHGLEIDSEEEATWTPIGTADNPFVGNFDGGGCTISGEMVTAADVESVGFFGVVDIGTVITNLTNAANITPLVQGGCQVGGIVGFAKGYDAALSQYNSTYIIACHNTGTITYTNSETSEDFIVLGGIAGYIHGGTCVLACSNTGGMVNNSSLSIIHGGIVGVGGTEINTEPSVVSCQTSKGTIIGENFGVITRANYTTDMNYESDPYYISAYTEELVWDYDNEYNGLNYYIYLFNEYNYDYTGRTISCNWHWELENGSVVLRAGEPT